MGVLKALTLRDDSALHIVIAGNGPNILLRALNFHAQLLQPCVCASVFVASTGIRDIAGDEDEVRPIEPFAI